jgi:hypothetical protein
MRKASASQDLPQQKKKSSKKKPVNKKKKDRYKTCKRTEKKIFINQIKSLKNVVSLLQQTVSIND